MKPGLTDKPHRKLAGYSDAHQRYSDRFVRALCDSMVHKLNLRESDHLVDLGGGTGIYTEAILELVPLQNPVTIVDPVAEMLAQVPRSLPVERVEMDALAYSRMPGELHKVLMKGTAHYVDDKAELFTNIYDKLSEDGVLLVVNTPPGIDHPLFQAALNRSETWYTESRELLSFLEESGFEVQMDSLDHDTEIPKYEYFQMVRERYLSLLASFTDDELEAGVAEMEQSHVNEDTLHLTDHFDFLTATKR